MAKKLVDQSLVTEFAQRRKQAKVDEAWLKEKRLFILDLVEEQGYQLPTGGPYLLKLEPSLGQIAWKKIMEDYLTEVLEKSGKKPGEARVRARMKMELLAAKAERTPYTQIECDVNPNWKEKPVPKSVSQSRSRQVA